MPVDAALDYELNRESRNCFRCRSTIFHCSSEHDLIEWCGLGVFTLPVKLLQSANRAFTGVLGRFRACPDCGLWFGLHKKSSDHIPF